MKTRGLPQPWQVVWKKEKKELRLRKEPVLYLELSWPEIQRGGSGGRRVSQYYRQVVHAWKKRWEKTLYCRACLDLAACQEQGSAFRPWSARLEGKVTFQDEESLSIVMDAWEDWGDGRPLQVRTADLWTVPDGRPCPRDGAGRSGGNGANCFRIWRSRGRSGGKTGIAFWTRTLPKNCPVPCPGGGAPVQRRGWSTMLHREHWPFR